LTPVTPNQTTNKIGYLYPIPLHATSSLQINALQAVHMRSIRA
jgi:hypothetical protein